MRKHVTFNLSADGKHMYVWMDGWMVMDGWMDRWMDGWVRVMVVNTTFNNISVI